MSSRIALVTVTYNSATALAVHWSDARDLGVDWIVVDNASDDASAQVAADLGATVIPLARNVGFSAANNIAADMTDVDCLIFVNPDVTVEREGMRKLAQRALLNRAIVAPQLTNPDGSPQENGRRAPFLYRKFLHFFGSRLSQSEYEVIAARGDVREVSWVIGAAVAIPADIFRAIGGWDDGFFIYYEDSDICLRARQGGVRTLLDGGVRWVHGWARATRRSFSWKIWRAEVVSALRFYRRYPGLVLHPRFFGIGRAPYSFEGD